MNVRALNRPFIFIISNDLQKGEGAESPASIQRPCTLELNTYFVAI